MDKLEAIAAVVNEWAGDVFLDDEFRDFVDELARAAGVEVPGDVVPEGSEPSGAAPLIGYPMERR